MVNTTDFVDVPVTDLAFEFVGAPGQSFLLRRAANDTVKLSSDRSQYVVRAQGRTIRIERANVAWFESFDRMDRVYLTGSPREMQQQREALLRGESLPPFEPSVR